MVTREVQTDPHVFQSVTKVVSKEYVWVLIPANVKQDMEERTAQSVSILHHQMLGCIKTLSVCKPGTWGPDCSKQCPCKNGATCDPESGKCSCSAGWLGALCNETCPARRYGQDCLEVCKCKNGA